MQRIVVGIDNGVSGSIGVLCANGNAFRPMPTITQLSYQKSVKRFSRRVDWKEFQDYIRLLPLSYDFESKETLVQFVLERPMINSTRFQASISAARALEAVLMSIEMLGDQFAQYSIEYIDSRTWQKALLPPGKGADEMKKLSSEIGKRKYPHHADTIDKQKDADGLLIAHFAWTNL